MIEAFLSGKKIDRLMVLKNSRDKKISCIIKEAKKHSDTCLKFTDRKTLDALSASKNHQGVMAWMSEFSFSTIEGILKAALDKNEDPFIFILDGIEDTHNLGAIIRTAHICGAHGVIIRKDRAAGLGTTVFKTSAGAVSYVPISRVTNIGTTIDTLKQNGLWVFCADMEGDNLFKSDLRGPIALVLGNEGKGVSRLVKKKCDKILRIPMFGNIGSLNASVAAGIIAYEVVRQRHFA